ncbi:Gfo/Idh/MocA family protein [Amycolatopsis palatopharyngis]|uniref:Gfo/Idh/MocA family protein n=1 Tax=Amycolatopsis palatopharyngis TaxID=187982 RepID=UPI000E282D19|nr:Gfo/Idh/MocA family oxidoreductase [Amycolatopsis palatopharyngis]
MSRVRLAVAGAGLIGRRHAALVSASAECELVGIADPESGAREFAEAAGVPAYVELADLLDTVHPDGVIVASPNRFHVRHGLQCVKAGVPVLVEKPIADTVAEAEILVEAAEGSGVPLLVGHHRRHSPILATARTLVERGVLGRLVAVMGSAVFCKPDTYFDEAPWRREPGGGPILINLIHEIDNLRALCGDIVSVQATASNEVRGFAVEDTVAITLRFASGALGTFLLSDTAAAARSWEQTSREDAGYPSYADEDCYVLAGTEGSLSIPSMRLRVFTGERSWWKPLRTSTVEVPNADPLARQLAHFHAVVRGLEQPIVDGRQGLETLRVTQAIAEAADSGQLVAT